MKLFHTLLLALPMAACVIDPTATHSQVERNAAAEADLNRGIVCKRQSSGDFELSKAECTTPDEREQRREANTGEEIERK